MKHLHQRRHVPILASQRCRQTLRIGHQGCRHRRRQPTQYIRRVQSWARSHPTIPFAHLVCRHHDLRCILQTNSMICHTGWRAWALVRAKTALIRTQTHLCEGGPSNTSQHRSAHIKSAPYRLGRQAHNVLCIFIICIL